MKANVCQGLVLLAISIACGIGSSAAWAQTIEPSPSPNSTSSQSNPSLNLQSPQTETDPGSQMVPGSQIAPNAQTAPTAQQQFPTCPAGQFASAFPDVRPEDWAYEAVNRLASVPIRCFSGSPQSL